MDPIKRLIIMKNIKFIIALLLLSLKVSAQHPTYITLPIEDKYHSEDADRKYTYFKDLNHVLDKYVGTWECHQGAHYIKITFIKSTNVNVGAPPSYDPKQTEDRLYTRILYTYNGTVMIDSYTTDRSHISGNDVNHYIPNTITLYYREPTLTSLCWKAKTAHLKLDYITGTNPTINWTRTDNPLHCEIRTCLDDTPTDRSPFVIPANLVLTKVP